MGLLGAGRRRIRRAGGHDNGLFRPRPALPCARAHTAPGEEYSLRHGAVRRRVRRRWPQAEVAEDLLDDLGLVNERNLCGAPHKSPYVKRLIM